jgi:hypothetical protein
VEIKRAFHIYDGGEIPLAEFKVKNVEEIRKEVDVHPDVFNVNLCLHHAANPKSPRVVCLTYREYHLLLREHESLFGQEWAAPQAGNIATSGLSMLFSSELTPGIGHLTDEEWAVIVDEGHHVFDGYPRTDYSAIDEQNAYSELNDARYTTQLCHDLRTHIGAKNGTYSQLHGLFLFTATPGKREPETAMVQETTEQTCERFDREFSKAGNYLKKKTLVVYESNPATMRQVHHTLFEVPQNIEFQGYPEFMSEKGSLIKAVNGKYGTGLNECYPPPSVQDALLWDWQRLEGLEDRGMPAEQANESLHHSIKGYVSTLSKGGLETDASAATAKQIYANAINIARGGAIPSLNALDRVLGASYGNNGQMEQRPRNAVIICDSHSYYLWTYHYAKAVARALQKDFFLYGTFGFASDVTRYTAAPGGGEDTPQPKDDIETLVLWKERAKIPTAAPDQAAAQLSERGTILLYYLHAETPTEGIEMGLADLVVDICGHHKNADVLAQLYGRFARTCTHVDEELHIKTIRWLHPENNIAEHKHQETGGEPASAWHEYKDMQQSYARAKAWSVKTEPDAANNRADEFVEGTLP